MNHTDAIDPDLDYDDMHYIRERNANESRTFAVLDRHKLLREVDRLNAELAEAKADAWDEGFLKGVVTQAVKRDGPSPKNPHRSEI